MGTTFGERLRASMLVSGMNTLQLGMRCRVSRQTAASWIDMEQPEIGTIRFLRLCDVAQVRVRWLAEGQGVPMPVTTSPIAEEALVILDAMPASVAERWMDMGRWLVENPNLVVP